MAAAGTVKPENPQEEFRGRHGHHGAMENLIAHLFLARELAHRAHLKPSTGPGSDAEHRALGAFYESIIGLADEILECFQGRFEVLLTIPVLTADPEKPIREVLKQQREWIDSQRYIACPREETSIQNLIDEAVRAYNKVNFRLLYLK